jgi:hypothetical protein
MDLGRLVFIGEGAKIFLKSLKQLPDRTIGVEKVPNDVYSRTYNILVEVYLNSNKLQGGVNLNVSYIGKDFGKRIVFTPPKGAEEVNGERGFVSFKYKGVFYLLTKFNESRSD